MKTGNPILVFSLGLFAVLFPFPYAQAFSFSSIQEPTPVRAVIRASTAAANAEVAQGAETFIASMSERALAFLADSSMPREQKVKEFKQLLDSSFDMETIGRFALGRYWRTATPEQRQEYQDLFRNMVLRVYAEKFDEYKGQNFVTRGVRLEGENDVIVSSFIVPGTGPEIQVDWRVRYKKSKFMIVDIIVEGVSMTVTQRSDFASVIQRGGGDINVLLVHLRGQ